MRLLKALQASQERNARLDAIASTQGMQYEFPEQERFIEDHVLESIRQDNYFTDLELMGGTA